ncbi:hypothetical protein LWI29_006169 [Acer saccharum]|uniref:Uncharacterized protein n=1 Tax=Acer saccharum TaxID=4024 RepID=A0AA39VJX1_ACESA|nr:hypothetical protein LWI29_006169 [Acer saccharum]
MDPSLRSSLFNQMMQALELGDKCTADRIESLIHNFHPDSPTPIFVYIPSFEEDFIPNIPSPSSFDNNAQTTVDSDVEDHQKSRLHFTADRPCSFDCEVNVVGEDELHKYKSRFDIPDAMTLTLPALHCQVPRGGPDYAGPTRPKQLQDIDVHVSDVEIEGLWTPTPCEIRHFYTLRQAGHGGTYFLLSSPVENWIPEGVANPGQVEVSSDEKKKGFIWGFPTSNKRWKNSWFFAGGEWGRDVPASGCRNLLAKRVPKHFTSPEAWSKAVPVLLDGEISHLAAAAVLPLDLRGRSFLLDEEKMIVQRDGEETGDVTGGGVESGQPPMHTEVAVNTPAATTPSRKGKEKVGFSRGVSDIPIFDTDVPKTPLDSASDLAPRTGRGKRPAEATHEGPAEGANAAVPPPEEVNELNIPALTPPRTVSPPVATGEPNASSGQPRPSGWSESIDRPGPSKQPGASASGSGVAHESPSVGSTEADGGTVSLSDFSAIEICSHLINNDVYIGEGLEHVKGKPCNRKMEFFFNCHSLMMSELAENYKYGNKVSREIKRLRKQASVLAVEKLFAEESYAQQLAQLRESADGYLSTQLAAKEKLSAAEEEIRSLKEQLSASQESLAARFEVERLAEEAKEKAEREALDLRNQLSSRDLIFDNLKAVLEVEAVDRFKRSPAYDALLLREFERGMRQSKSFFAMKDHSNEKTLRRFDKSLQLHMASRVGSIKEQRKRWKAHCHYNRTEPHPMHLEIPSKRAFNTYYSGQKGSFSGFGAEPDLGLVAGRDYGHFMPVGIMGLLCWMGTKKLPGLLKMRSKMRKTARVLLQLVEIRSLIVNICIFL